MVFPAQLRVLPYAALFGLTFAMTLCGILARPIESLSLFWPVNAVLIGVLLRYPRQAGPIGFGLVWLAMVAADSCSLSGKSLFAGPPTSAPASQLGRLHRMGHDPAEFYVHGGRVAGLLLC